MYKCEDCERFFTEPDEQYEHDTGYRELTCPYCGSDDYYESEVCRICGECSGREDYCDECMSGFDVYVDRVISTKIHPAAEVLASYYEGYPKDANGECMYCTGTNCENCKEIVEAVIHIATGILGCDKSDIECMASQNYCW